MIKRSSNNLVKFLALVMLPLIMLTFSACSLSFDPSGLVPKVFINTDARLSFDDEVYKLEMTPGDEYAITADLGDYDGTEFFIEYALESETDSVVLTDNKIKVSDSISQNETVTVLVNLKKNDEEKIYSTDKILVLIIT